VNSVETCETPVFCDQWHALRSIGKHRLHFANSLIDRSIGLALAEGRLQAPRPPPPPTQHTELLITDHTVLPAEPPPYTTPPAHRPRHRDRQTDMAAISQQLPTAQLRDPLIVTFSRSSGDERTLINSGTTFLDLGPMADGWTDRISPRPAAVRTARAAAVGRPFLFRFRAPTDEAIEIANTFASY
jgi:hypothetical protein